MNESFASAETERLFATGKSRRLPPEILKLFGLSMGMRMTLKLWTTTEE